MSQYLLLKSNGDSDDPRLGLTSDQSYEGGVLGGDTYTASETTLSPFSDFFTSFDTSTWTVHGDASYISSEERVQLTPNSGGQDGALEYESGISDTFWETTFKFEIAQSGSADDVWMMFYTSNPTTYATSDGYSVAYDHYNDQIQIHDKYSGNTYSTSYTFDTPNVYNGRVRFEDGTISVYLDGDLQIEHTVSSPNYQYSGFGYAGRTGGSSADQYINSLEIATELDRQAYTSTVSISDNNSSSTPIGNTQASSLVDQEGSSFTQTTPNAVRSSTGAGTVITEVFPNRNREDFRGDWGGEIEYYEWDGVRGLENTYDNYSQRVRGWLIPPETGTYYFWISADNTGDLWLDDTQVLDLNDWTAFKDWTKYPNQQKSGAIELTAGVPVKFEAYMREYGGGDNLAIGWRKPSDGDAATPVGLVPAEHFQSAVGSRSTITSSTSTTLSSALRDAFTASTFGNSSSDTTAGGLTELFGHTDQTAAIQSSSLVQAAIANASSATFGNSSASAISQALIEAFDAGVFLADGTTSSQSQSAPTTAAADDSVGSFTTQTTAGGLIELFTHAGQTATLDTSTVVNALTESFDTVDRTAIGDALTGVTGDTTVATSNGLQSLGNALAEPLVAAETALFTEQDATGSFSDAYADALRASGSTLPTSAVGDTAVTSLGTAQVATGTPQFDQTTVEMFAFVSPESTTASPTVGTFDTSTNAVALTEDAVMVPITPTMDVVVAVKKGEIGLEGAFADSLSADVGASTTIKVAKTVANAEQQGGALDTAALPDAIAATAEALGKTGSFTTQTTAEALTVAAALQSFGSSSTMSDTLGELVTSDSTTIGAGGFSSATPDAAVRDVVASELDASVNTRATPEVLAAAAQTLTEQGVADTQTEAAALVSKVVGTGQRTDDFAATGVLGSAESFDTIDRTGRPTTFTHSQSDAPLASALSVNTEPFTESTSEAAVRDAVASELDASGDTRATPEVLAAAAQTLTEQGVVDTETEAAALVSQYAGNVLQSDEQASTLSDGAVEALSGESLITTEDASAVSDSLASVFNGDAIEGSVDTEALALISATLVSTLGVSGDAFTETLSEGGVAGADVTPLEALLRILYAATEGENFAIPEAAQNIRVKNEQNYVEVQN